MFKKIFFTVALILLAVPVLAADSTITFGWDQSDVARVTGWRLYQSDTAGGPYTQAGSDIIYDGTSTEFTSDYVLDVPANAETTYYFVVRAYNEYGESGNSNEVSKTYNTQVPQPPFTLIIKVVVGP